MSCRDVRPWLHRDSEGLPEPDRLVLEEHLQGCATCRTERAQWMLVRRIGSTLPAEPLGPRGHARVVAAALMRGSQPSMATEAPRPRWPLAFAAAAVVATGAIVWFVVRDSDKREAVATPELAPPQRQPAPVPPVPPPAPAPPPPPPAAHDIVVESGKLEQGGTALVASADVPTNEVLRTREATRISIYGARVLIGASSQFTVRDRAIIIERGTVQVLEGSATVVARDGKRRELAAGESVRGDSTVRVSATDALARAHATYANGAFDEAAQHARSALAASPTRAQAADADTILAECEQALGKSREAISSFLAIANRYTDLPAGETALFAAARLAQRSSPDLVPSILNRYLARYPKGRFSEEARRSLKGQP